MRLSLVFVCACVAWLCAPACGQYVLEDIHDPKRYTEGFLILPYAFYTPSSRFGGGFIWTTTGLLQPQAGSWGLAFGDVNNTYGIEGGWDDFQIRPIQRLFVSSEFGLFRYNYDTIFIGGNSQFPGVPVGTNDSNDDNKVLRRYQDDWGHVEFKYLLPIGGGRETIINHYMTEEGLLKSGATGGFDCNPLVSGRTYLTLTPFFEYFTVDRRIPDLHFNENGLRFGAVYDNTDFALNPSRGNIFKFTFSRDFGLFDTSHAWSNLTEEVSQMIDMGHSTWFRQQVIALDGWTSCSPGFKRGVVGGRSTIVEGPPFYDGATLGGDSRFRGYFSNRFYDRSAILGTVELRLIPDWNPFKKLPLIEKADIAWMQWVIFGEIGRVAPNYTPDIFSHLKGDAGFGFRILANDTFVRFDVAASNERFAVWAGLSQPF